ncbi:hypothetical protein MJO28_007015 [Puccinia striiformis f. sp. tritici]|uniref:3-methyl-2-oxobutanoate dehydrogenase (2-methylpropanoyl-transferring) n=2 Tax=Puccinia striiformis TaxID=27350 RepID=A0A2S4V4J5_9BASI|nr:hypothetical protein Pst134EA_013117 [Puccinia striiformis f. sp. tritici]KAH9465226.1 hypothetical protein Pst134EA_013117 [Puccinia striiformis f. sp. tritici]KAI7951331.1 hypothetical protein MJO28_007015 [Puccinia striiformis f. sp. tritici]KAI9622671.1 hypothetical protein H4Q26_014951 [Puccinia striiformis f. sp. tritici PST-130]POW04418.1 hypothetical protein PSHT_11282 [Puccinia striiformis]
MIRRQSVNLCRTTATTQHLNQRRAFRILTRRLDQQSSTTTTTTSSYPTLSTSSYLSHQPEDLDRVHGLTRSQHSSTLDHGPAVKLNMFQAIRDALAITLQTDESAVLFGEDVAFGGVFRCSLGLAEEYGPDRVFNTPLTEQGIAGFGIGMATMGHTAIAEIQFGDYIFPAFDQLVNEAAKLRYRSGGSYNCGKLTIRTPIMAVGHGGLYHSQSPEGFFQQASGLKVVIPRSPTQAKGLLLASIRDPNPVIFMEPKILYRSSVEWVPSGDYTILLDKAEIVQKGTDLTIISYGTTIYNCELAISMINNPPPEIAHLIPNDLRNLSIELIDLRTVVPFDQQTVFDSVSKTGRVIVVHEAAYSGGIGAELTAKIQEHCFTRLEAPVKRVCGWDTPFPLVFEKFYLPDQIRILDAIVETMTY